LEFASDFERSLAEINTILGDGGVSIQQYEKQLLELSTQSSKTLDDLSKGLYQTISAGIPAVEGASGAFSVLEASQRAAVAGLTTVESSVDGTVSVLNAYGRDTIFATDVTDKLFTTVKLGRVTFDQLAKGIGRVAPIAASAGVALDDVLAVFVQLTRQGIKPAEAITGLRNILKTLVRPTSKSTKLIKDLNTQLAAVGQEQVKIGSAALRDDGLIGVLRNLTQATGGSTEALAAIFPNVRALIPAIVSVGEGFEDTVSFQKALINSSGATAAAFALIDATFSETFAKLQSNIGRIAVLAFDKVLVRINGSLKKLNKTFGEKNAINEIVSSLKTAISVAEFFATTFVSVFSVVSESISSLLELFGLLFDILSLGTESMGVAALSFGALSVAMATATGGAGLFFGAMNVLGSALLPIAGLATAAAGGIGTLSASLTTLVGPFLAVGAAASALFLSLRSITNSLIESSGSVKSFGDLFAGAGTALKNGDILISLIGLLASAFVGLFDVLSRVVALILIIPATLFGMEGAIESLGSVFTDGLFGPINSIKELNSETQKLHGEMESLKSTLASGMGFDTFDQALGFADDINEGRRVSLGDVAGEDLTRLREADSLIRSAAARAPDISDAFSKAQFAATGFFEKLEEGEKKSKLTGSEIQARLEQQLKSKTDLNDLEARSVATQVSIEVITRAMAEATKEVLDNTKSSTGYSILQANARAVELQTQLDILKGLDEENLKRRRAADLALRRARKSKANRALDGLEKIRAKNERLLLSAAIKRVEQTRKREGLELELLKIDQKKLEDSRKLLDLELDRIQILKISKDLQVEGVTESFKSAIELSDRLNERRIVGLKEQAVLEKRQISFQQLIEDRKSKLREAGIKDSEDADLRSLEKIEKVLGSIAVTPVKELVRNAGQTLADLEAATRNPDLYSNDQIKFLQSFASALRDAAADSEKLNEVLIKNTEGEIDALRRAQRQLGIDALNVMTDSISNMFQRSEFKASLKRFATDLGVEMGEAAKIFMISLGDRLKGLGVDFSTGRLIGEDQSKLIQDLKVILGNSNDSRLNDALKNAVEIEAKLRKIQEDAFFTGDKGAIAKARGEVAKVRELQSKLLRSAGQDDAGVASVLRELDQGFTLLQGSTLDIGLSLLRERKAIGEIREAAFLAESSVRDAPGNVASGIAEALGGIGLNFGNAILAGLTPVFSATSSLVSSSANLVSESLTQISVSLSSSFNKAVDEMGEIENVFERGAIIGSARIAQGLTKAFFVSAEIVTQSISTGFSLGLAIFTEALSRVFDALGTAVTAPIDRLLGSLGEAVGVLADTPEEEDRRDRKEALELQRATLAELQRSGASNEMIAQEQAALAALLRSSQSDEPQTAAGRLEEEINRSVEAALRIADQLGPLVQQFFVQVIEKIPEVVPKLFDGLVAALDMLTEYFPEFIQTLTEALMADLPKIIRAIIRLIPAIVEALARAVAVIIFNLPEIIGTIFAEAGRELVRSIRDMLSIDGGNKEAVFALTAGITLLIAWFQFSAIPALIGIIGGPVAILLGVVVAFREEIGQFFVDIGNWFVGIGTSIKDGIGDAFSAVYDGIVDAFNYVIDGIKSAFNGVVSGGGTAGRVARGILTLGISEAWESNPFGISFHTGGNVTSGMKNKSLASQYRAAGVQGFLDGGMVGDTLRRNFRASMSDDVPALLQTGEAVLNRSAVSNIGGPSAIDAINSGAGVAPNLNVSVGINPNANGLGQAAAALLPFLIGSISVAGPGSKPSSQNLMGFRGIGGAPLIRQS
jgi:TP901 family phage tail tape measure protein